MSDEVSFELDDVYAEEAFTSECVQSAGTIVVRFTNTIVSQKSLDIGSPTRPTRLKTPAIVLGYW
eukprot:982613-Prorocentrum_minimum.AAC.1